MQACLEALNFCEQAFLLVKQNKTTEWNQPTHGNNMSMVALVRYDSVAYKLLNSYLHYFLIF